MTWSLLDVRGQRKYLTAKERAAFIEAAIYAHPVTSSFCLTLVLTGARISEVLALTADRIDTSNAAIVVETLKRRQRGMYRAIPVPYNFIEYISIVHNLATMKGHERLWTFSRPTAWKRTKLIMHAAGIPLSVAKPKSLRHAFAVEAVRQRVALSLVQKWLGHSKIETTAIYADPIGEEERELASKMWPVPAQFRAAVQRSRQRATSRPD